ncbi:hypothetical protein IV454_22970 [Massilia antarctica]|uniref:Uncharacterized protein n=2 Tax=Massilia antarctica TaxID=2765360 RepID=A0AA49ACI6_9BURK|nr:hypothetical protein IV454_22970 [Massilia antarctica]
MSSSAQIIHLAMVSETKNVKVKELLKVSSALQKQVIRDLSPIWEVNATVDSFADLEDVPADYWPIIVRDDIHTPGAAGIHLDKNGSPFALVQHSAAWSLTASHECIEMLCDPNGNRVIAGQSPKPKQGRVLFLVEPCDASEAAAYAYTVNGITVSDFYTPHFFDPMKVAGVRYSYTGAITAPREVLPGGYLSWQNLEDDHWYQEVYFDNKPSFRDLGPLTQANGSIRSQIYSKTPETRQHRENGLNFLTAAGLQQVDKSGYSRAQQLHAQIESLNSGH